MPPLFANVATICLAGRWQDSSGFRVDAGVYLRSWFAVALYSDGSIDLFFGVQGEMADLVGPAAVGAQSDAQIITAGTITSGLSLSGNSTGFGLTGSFPSGLPNLLFGTRGGTVTRFRTCP